MAHARSLIVVGAKVHTLAATEPVGEPPDAVLVKESRITAVGRLADLRAQAPAAALLERPGATLAPGLTDAHVHFNE